MSADAPVSKQFTQAVAWLNFKASQAVLFDVCRRMLAEGVPAAEVEELLLGVEADMRAIVANTTRQP